MSSLQRGSDGLSSSSNYTSSVMELPESTRKAREEHIYKLLKSEVARRTRTIFTVTDVDDVKKKLRELGHPITLFSEGPVDRRDRLKMLLAEIEVQRELETIGIDAVVAKIENLQPNMAPLNTQIMAPVVLASDTVEEKTELFYTPASEDLIDARSEISSFSFKRATDRLFRMQEIFKSKELTAEEDDRAVKIYSNVKDMRTTISQFADERPLASVSLNPNNNIVATGSWGPTIKLWDPNNGIHLASLKGHSERVSALAWNPQGGPGYDLLASGGGDTGVRLWKVPTSFLTKEHSLSSLSKGDMKSFYQTENFERNSKMEEDFDLSELRMTIPSSKPSKTTLSTVGIREAAVLNGHTGRVAAVAFHPNGKYLGSSSHDTTWRLWDIETQKELLLQEGHIREVHPISFHPDGSLVATGDLSGLGRIWDLRSGKSVVTIKSHLAQIVSLDFSPTGYLLASGSDDKSAHIYELRQQRTLYQLPAHAGLISKVKFAPTSGEYVATSSFDSTIRIWSTRDFSLLNTLRAHDGKITSFDISNDDIHLVSVGFDKTFKTWANSLEF